MSTAQSPVSQLLERNAALFADKHLLIAGYMEDNYPLVLAKAAASLLPASVKAKFMRLAKIWLALATLSACRIKKRVVMVSAPLPARAKRY